MSERYLQSYKGIVEEVQLPGKAILAFNLQNQQHRALLWVKGFIHEGKNLEPNDSFVGKLAAGDVINFDCHTYDRESRDKCGWYAPKAWKETHLSNNAPTNPRVINQTGYIFKLYPGKGVVQFTLNDEEEKVFFMKSKFYNFGRRIPTKQNLTEFLAESDVVQFDAEMCEDFQDSQMYGWFASLVWKGKKPIGANSWSGAGRSGVEDVAAEDSVSNTDRDHDDLEFPSLPLPTLPPGLYEKQGYKMFEGNGCSREGLGNVVALVNEECGIALWMVKPNTWESVFFHRKQAYIVDTGLSKFDLQESLVIGIPLKITAVPALPEFPCRWIARKIVVNC